MIQRASTQWILITAGCIGVFVALRLLPVESCEFLHYGDYVDSEGVIEGCGYEETNFFDLSQLRFPIIFELIPDQEPVVGKEVAFTLALRTTTGRSIDYRDIAVTHTERVHAMVVDQSLEDYQHIHPQPGGPSGHFRFRMTPHKAGPYRVYLDFIPLINNRRTLLAAKFEVSPTTGGRTEDNQALVMKSSVAQFGNHRFKLALDTDALRAEAPFELELVPLAEGPNKPEFELVMGAYAHLVAFDPQRLGFAHLHPMNPIVEGQDPKNPDLRFQLELDKPGRYRIWAQIRIGREDVFLPFDLSLES